MAGEWRTVPLEECLDALIDYRGISPPKSPTGIPVISAKVIKDGRIQTPIEQRISEDDYTSWMRRGSPEAGDVILTTEGPLGEAAILDAGRYAPGQRVVFLRGRSQEAVSRYLFYFLRSSFGQAELKQRATGTTVEGISQAELRRVPIRLPSLQQT
jgi:type I restriction enzyme, S subunit